MKGKLYFDSIYFLFLILGVKEGAPCKSLWDNSCTDHNECCSQFCYRESHWKYGVCKQFQRYSTPSNSPASYCKMLWDNTCVSNGECCSNYCFKESHWRYGVCKSLQPEPYSPPTSCKPLMDNSCIYHEDCCSGNCYREGYSAYGVCRPKVPVPYDEPNQPAITGGYCKPLWSNSCTRNDDCCSKYCFREPHWAFGVCKPDASNELYY